MQPSSLVFVAIVAGWAAYLVPQWVRRREQLAAGRTQDRHSLKARVLAPRRAVTRPEVASGGRLHRTAARGPAADPAPSVSARHGAARRRRVVLLVLLALAAVGGAATLLPSVPGWVGVPGAVLVVLDVLAVIVTAPGRGRAPAEAPVRRAPARWSAPVPLVGEPTPAGRGAAPVAPEPEVAAAVDDTWTPVPVPLPTYALKPSAPRPAPRPLAPPEASVALAEPVVVLPADPATEELPVLDLDAVLARRRASAG